MKLWVLQKLWNGEIMLSIVYVENEILDSKEHQFYLIFYSERDIEIKVLEGKNFKHGKVDEVVSIEKLPKLFDKLKRLKDSTSVWIKVIEWFMGFRIFR